MSCNQCCDCESDIKYSPPPYMLFGLTKCKNVSVTLCNKTKIITPNKKGQWIFDLVEFEHYNMKQRKVKVNDKTFKIDKSQATMEINLNAKTNQE